MTKTKKPSLFSRLSGWVARRYATYTTDGKFWLTVGFVCLVVDVAVGFLAGAAQATFWHGVGFAMLAVGFAFLPDAAYEEFHNERYASGLLIAALCIPIGVKAFEQQITYSAGMRHGEIQHTNIVNAKHKGAQLNVEENRTNLTLWQGQLAKLEAERADAVKSNPWLTTTKATALRAQLPVLDEKIANEIAGGRGGRPKGCKAVCESLKDEKNKIEGQIAAAEKLEGATAKIAELTTKIEATKKVLDDARTIADTTEHKDSLNLSVAKFTSQIVNIARGASPQDAIDADEVLIRYATLASAGLGSLALLIMAPVGFFLAGRRRKDEDESTPPETMHTEATPTHTEAPTPITRAKPKATFDAIYRRETAARGVTPLRIAEAA